MKDEKNKEAEPQVLGAGHPELRSREVRPSRGATGRAKDQASGKKVRQARNGISVSVPSGNRKATMSKSARSLLPKPWYVELVFLLISLGSGALTSIGLGLRAALRLLAAGVLRTGRGFLRMLSLLVQGVVAAGSGFLRMMGLLAQGVVEVGRGILRMLSLLVRGVVAAGRGILGLLNLLVRGVVAAGKGILGLLKLLAQGVARAGRRVLGVAELLLQEVLRPGRWVLGHLLQGVIFTGRRVQELVKLLVEAAGHLIPTRRVEPEAIGVITSDGGPRVNKDVAAEATVLITLGLDQGRSFRVGGQPVTIGSGENCAIRLPAAPGFAAEHARLWWRDGQRMLHHLAPGQATIVAGKQIIWTSLQDGDEASIGPYSLRITTAPASVSS